MVYATGLSGFLGSYLKERIEAEHIPHEFIHAIKLKPFSDFYFLSTYGNLIDHTDEEQIIKANVLDLVHILSQINFSKINSFIYVSTSSVKRHTQTFYSRMKKSAEEILLACAEKYNSPICIVRPFSITGVGEQPQHLIPTLIRSCLSGERIPFEGEPVHDFIDVRDVVDGILTLSKRRARGIFELGTGKSYSNSQVRDIVEGVCRTRANIYPVTHLRSYDSTEWVSTNFRARQFGWIPKRKLEDTILEMKEDYDKS